MEWHHWQEVVSSHVSQMPRYESIPSPPGELMIRDLPSIMSHYPAAPRDSGTQWEDMRIKSREWKRILTGFFCCPSRVTHCHTKSSLFLSDVYYSKIIIDEHANSGFYGALAKTMITMVELLTKTKSNNKNKIKLLLEIKSRPYIHLNKI